MNTLTQNTVSDTPSFLQFNQFESTGIRELTPEEIELVNGACDLNDALFHGAAGGATGWAIGRMFGPKAGVISAGTLAIGSMAWYAYKNCFGV